MFDYDYKSIPESLLGLAEDKFDFVLSVTGVRSEGLNGSANKSCNSVVDGKGCDDSLFADAPCWSCF